jgi:hypothetical protein
MYLFLNYFFHGVIQNLPWIIDNNFNVYLNNNALKIVPFTDFDSTEYIVAEAEAAAQKRELEYAKMIENSE